MHGQSIEYNIISKKKKKTIYQSRKHDRHKSGEWILYSCPISFNLRHQIKTLSFLFHSSLPLFFPFIIQILASYLLFSFAQ
jgi:hypothetical protein